MSIRAWFAPDRNPPRPTARGASAGLGCVMLGRAAYQHPSILLDVDPRVFGARPPSASREAAVRAHMHYIEARLREGVPLHAMTRHMLGLYHGQHGGRLWRRIF